jgi:hypothetical protein
MLHLTLVLFIFAARPAFAQYFVPVTPATVQWGHFDANAKPVLTVRPGEIVTIDKE